MNDVPDGLWAATLMQIWAGSFNAMEERGITASASSKAIELDQGRRSEGWSWNEVMESCWGCCPSYLQLTPGSSDAMEERGHYGPAISKVIELDHKEDLSP